MNWRKPLIYSFFQLQRRKVAQYHQTLKQHAYAPSRQRESLEREKLERLLLHCFRNVPYYQEPLEAAGVVAQNKVRIENFARIPVLTKDIIRREGARLLSRDYTTRRPFENTSGGSTGEPVRLIQDQQFDDWVLASRIYFNHMAGKEVGQPEIKLWGSERDIFAGAEKLSTKLRRFGFNLLLLNSFAMTEADMARYVEQWNRFQPRLVWAYTSSIYEFARFVQNRGAALFRPASIICTAETLTEDVRRFVESVFGCPLLNQYGSREAGILACECPQQEGLHTFPLHNKIEILDDQLEPVGPGQMGDIYLTTLNNYSMPLVRYRIGDSAIAGSAQECRCGRTWPLIKSVTGRTSDHFRTRDGKLVHGEYFTHLFYNRQGVIQFQVVQSDYDDIQVLVHAAAPLSAEVKNDIVEKIQLVMGDQCRVSISEVQEIPRLASGKYRYTICKIDPNSA